MRPESQSNDAPRFAVSRSAAKAARAAIPTSPLDLPSRASREVLAEVRNLSRFPTISVVLIGPSGTGKSLYAKELHRCSSRSEGPCVYMNLAATPEALAASELRGHERGAFTGAIDRRVGMMRTANGGTLILDEIGKASLPVQHELLSMFDRTPFAPVGSDRVIHHDARLVALSSIPLAAAKRSGAMIPDLYERLKMFVVEIAPLSKCKVDIPVIFGWAVRHHATEFGLERVPVVDPEVILHLQRLPLSGNHRELDGIAQRMLVNAAGATVLSLTHLPRSSEDPPTISKRSSRERFFADQADPSGPRLKTVLERATHYDVSEATIYRWQREIRDRSAGA